MQLGFTTFTKMHGLGNDFVILGGEARVTDELARRLADRHLGIGCDQVIQISRASGGPEGHDCTMTIWNPDGSRAEMCGNGIRAAALWMLENGWERPASGQFRISTDGGLKVVEFRDGGLVRVDMGAARLGASAEAIQVGVEEFQFFEVSMGNPHAVVFVDDVATVHLEQLGPAFERHKRFLPARTNVEFVQVLGPSRLRVRVWERGAGATLACGTGACAAAFAAVQAGRIKGVDAVDVELPGGVLKIEFDAARVWMTGPATKVFEGKFIV